MKVLFVWPNKDTFGCKPMGISLLSALLKRDGHETALFDTTFYDLGVKDYNQELTDSGYFRPVDWGVDVSKKKVFIRDALTTTLNKHVPDIVAISILDDETDSAIEIINEVYSWSDKNSKYTQIVIGNKGAEKIIEADSLPDTCVTLCGEAIETLPEYVNKVEINNGYWTHVDAPGRYFKELDTLPCLDWSLFDDRHFLKAYDGRVYRGGDHMIGWGCTNSCAYCVNEHWREMHGGMKGCLRTYSVGRICDELVELTERYSLGFWKFHDEDFFLKPLPYLEELSETYRTIVGLPFACMANAKSVTETRAKLIADMGCVSVSMGIETGDPTMRQMLRRRESVKDIINAVRILKDHGIRVSAFNMIGLPFETEATIEETIWLNRIAGIEHPNISLYMPLNGTLLYDLSVRYGFYKPEEHKELRTDRPSLKLPGISEERLLWYYRNFGRLVKEGAVHETVC